MADDVLTRNSADELALRVAQSSGDTGTNKDDVYTRDSQGRLAVRTVGGSGGGGGSSENEFVGKTSVVFEGQEYSIKPELKLGVLEDGEYEFRLKTRALLDGTESWKAHSYNETGWLESRFRFEVKNGAVSWAEAVCESPVRKWGYRNLYIDGSVVGLLGKNSDGEFFIYVNDHQVQQDGRFLCSDVFWGIFDGVNGQSYDVWEYTKLKRKDGREFDIILENKSGSYETPANIAEVYYINYGPVIEIPHQEWYTSCSGGGNAADYESGYVGFLINGLWMYNVVPNDGVMYKDFGSNTSGIWEMVVYIASEKTDGSDKGWVKIRITGSMKKVVANIIDGDGTFKDCKFEILHPSDNEYLPEFVIYTKDRVVGFDEEYRYAYSVSYYGMPNMVLSMNMFLYDITEERLTDVYKYKLCDVMVDKKPTEQSSYYEILHENGLIEMGGIVSINETLQPDVALGNVPVVFQNELGNANFVPTITVMTDGAFKKVMADVANPTTTGFDLCVRNVDTEEVSNIKIAWKVVGTKK